MVIICKRIWKLSKRVKVRANVTKTVLKKGNLTKFKVTLTFRLATLVLCTRLRQVMMTICTRLFENPTKRDKHMERVQTDEKTVSLITIKACIIDAVCNVTLKLYKNLQIV